MIFYKIVRLQINLIKIVGIRIENVSHFLCCIPVIFYKNRTKFYFIKNCEIGDRKVSLFYPPTQYFSIKIRSILIEKLNYIINKI